jgi:mono/diheme cytochrome c family protein
MKRNVVFTAFLVVVVLAAFSIGPSASAVDGKEIFLAQKCNMCHSVSTAGIERTTKSEKMAAMDLINLDKDAATLTKYIKKETDLDGKKHGKAWTGTDEELGAVVTWILQQKK